MDIDHDGQSARVKAALAGSGHNVTYHCGGGADPQAKDFAIPADYPKRNSIKAAPAVGHERDVRAVWENGISKGLNI